MYSHNTAEYITAIFVSRPGFYSRLLLQNLILFFFFGGCSNFFYFARAPSRSETNLRTRATAEISHVGRRRRRDSLINISSDVTQEVYYLPASLFYAAWPRNQYPLSFSPPFPDDRLSIRFLGSPFH